MRLLKVSFILSFIFFFGMESNAHAVFNLSVAPRRGGQSIRFESVKPGSIPRNEEVTLTVTTDRAVQYHIFQTMFQPLTNELGDTIPQANFIVFSPSNPSGTLTTELETPVTMGQVPIYSSNAAGDSEEFTLVYNVKVPENQPGGTYRTSISFRAEPINATAGVSAGSVTLDVRVEIRPTFRMDIISAQGGKALNLGKISKDQLISKAALKVQIESNIGTTYRLVQQLTEPLTSQDGVVLDEESVQFSVLSPNSKNAAQAGSTQLTQGPQVVYTSSETGEGDVFEIQYTCDPDMQQESGTYSGNLSFKVEANSPLVTPEIINIPVRFEVEPIFYIDVESEQGSQLHFGTFNADLDVQNRKVTITVHSNLGQPYQVMQVVSRKLSNPEGSQIPAENFTVLGSETAKGTMSVLSPKPVQEGQTPIYTSDSKGTPQQLILNYELKIPLNAKAGAYSSELNYTIITL